MKNFPSSIFWGFCQAKRMCLMQIQSHFYLKFTGAVSGVCCTLVGEEKGDVEKVDSLGLLGAGSGIPFLGFSFKSSQAVCIFHTTCNSLSTLCNHFLICLGIRIEKDVPPRTCQTHNTSGSNKGMQKKPASGN